MLSATAQAREVDETIDAAAKGHVDISNVAGEINVEGWSRNSVRVEGTLGENVEELVLERDDKTVTVKVKVPRHSRNRISSDITVFVPEASSIDVSGVSADIDIEGVTGKQSLHTVSGDVTAEAHAAIDAHSVSGDVRVKGDGKVMEVRANTVSGDVDVSGVNGEIAAEAVSGDVIVKAGTIERFAAETVNGDIELSGKFARGGRIAASSVNGDVDIRFDGAVSADFDIETFNGDIDSCFGPEPRRTSKYAPGLELEFSEGAGDGSVTVETLNGDIHICN
jgi:DUF4097 and DUF4098 domain-containing protein YvlB